MIDYTVQQAADAHIRLFHAFPSAAAVDVYANGNLIARNLGYRQFSPYIPIRSGGYFINVFPAGQVLNSMLQTSVAILPDSVTTFAISGDLANLILVPVPEPRAPGMRGTRPLLRFVHLSPNTPAVNITTTAGERLAGPVSYGRHTSFFGLPEGVSAVQVRNAGNNQVLLTIPNINIAPGMAYTAYLIGLLGQAPPLETVFSRDVSFG